MLAFQHFLPTESLVACTVNGLRRIGAVDYLTAPLQGVMPDMAGAEPFLMRFTPVWRKQFRSLHVEPGKWLLGVSGRPVVGLKPCSKPLENLILHPEAVPDTYFPETPSQLSLLLIPGHDLDAKTLTFYIRRPGHWEILLTGISIIG